jgi:outer membrane protein assembly factor BamA
MKKFRKFIYVITVSVFALHSCSVEKFIPEDEYLYEGANVKLDTASNVEDIQEIQAELQNVIRPEPNSKILGMRPGLYFYYKAQRKKPGFINKFLNKRIGEEPVYLSDVEITTTQDLLINRLENRGFFYSSVDGSINRDEEDQTAGVTYNANLPTPYKLENYELDNDSLLVYQEIKKLLPESPFDPGMRFDLPLLKLERERIDSELKEKGFYNFNPGFLLFEADTNQYDQKRFDLFLRLKEEVPERGIVPYKINTVNVYPNYVVGNDSLMRDTVSYEGKNFIREEEFFKPNRLDPFILIQEGQNYSPSISRNTSRRLGSIGAYKFVNIRYDEIDSLSTDSLGVLETNIFLSPLNKRAIRAELQAVTKSNNFAGPSLALTFSNRNLWKGGETLNLTANFGYEVQIAGGDNAGLNSINIGLEADLLVPRLLFPISIEDNWFEYSIPKTKISLGGNYLSRSQLYTLLSASSTFGYLWNANRYVTHELNPVSVSYSQLSDTTEEFEQILDDNPFLRSSFEQRFIAGLTYSFTYNGMLDENKTHQFFVNSTLDIAGNLISLLSGSSDDEGEPNKFLGMPYAQYAKADVDFRYHLNIGNEQKIATRFFAGLGRAYGNSDVMPFPKQYFSGGPYSVRAFRTRSLGPGSYTPEGDITYFDQTGNLRLEANIEYRFPIIQFLKGAVFADAGNVWNTEEENALPGGLFESDFTSELGVGIGAGLRVDIQSFVIRFDLAAPMHDPSLPEGERWTYDFGSPILNFAIGYPF